MKEESVTSGANITQNTDTAIKKTFDSQTVQASPEEFRKRDVSPTFNDGPPFSSNITDRVRAEDEVNGEDTGGFMKSLAGPYYNVAIPDTERD